ncbi:MAG: hypothetical protein CMO74_00210 [Verrucomicrobiales bacterium]|nr:hypothetical protein [Verrucomicrobiales bacterium]|tara:strand:- start:518 stop:772 length:255 start_codon:yes stop_codon:yes gene_type:complete
MRMRLFAKGTLVGVLLLAAGCQGLNPLAENNYFSRACREMNPFKQGTAIHRVWGLPPKALARALNISETERLRVEHFQEGIRDR